MKKKIDGSDPFAFDKAFAAPPTKPPLAPSASDAEVRRQRAELKILPEHAIRSIHMAEHGGRAERLLSDERERRNAEARHNECVHVYR